MKHKMHGRIFLVLFLFILNGCLHDDLPPQKQEPSLTSQIKTESDSLSKKQGQWAEDFEKISEKKIIVNPVFPKFNPLEDSKISFSIVDERLDTVLYLLADTVGMNLLLDGKLASGQNRVTLNFQNVSAKIVLKELTDQFDLDYQINGNIIRIRSWADQFFSLNFLDTNVEMNFDVGGDVLGGSGTETASGLSGNVSIKGKGSEKANPYVIIEEMITKIKSKDGILSLNRLSGTLYIKDKPSIVKNVAKLVNHFKEMLSRQILIEARIIEVTLSNGFEYGIDWNLVKADSTASSIELSRAAWNLSNGLVLEGFNSSFTFSSVISALETFGKVKIVSNPTIRAKHGKVAIISVGDSITYKKTVESIIEQTSFGQTERRSVEVSTQYLTD